MTLKQSSSSEGASSTQQIKDTVARLARSVIFRDYQRAFEALTGLPLAIRAAGAFQATLHASKNCNPFCTSMAASNKTCAACLDLQQRLENTSELSANTLECFAGLNESTVAIRAGDSVIGFLQTGQIFLHSPAADHFKKVEQQFEQHDTGIDWSRLKKAYFASRILRPAQYESILRLLTIFAEHLSSISSQITLSIAVPESPMIAKARAYIDAHKTDDLSLSEVAKAMNSSAFYFCKQFKKGTGLTFTEYIAQTRVETVKLLLVNPFKRISEAAFEAGFQSLSQFNRIFARTTGGSPTTFRLQLRMRSRTATERYSIPGYSRTINSPSTMS